MPRYGYLCPEEHWVTDLPHTLPRDGHPATLAGKGGTQYESPVTVFLPAHSIEMENEEGSLWNAGWTGAWR
jgi:hypothetical protein